MLIRVLYADGRYDMVKPFFLDWLIASGRIVMFRRDGRWALVGRDPLRQRAGGRSEVADRRRFEPPPLLACLALRLHAEMRAASPAPVSRK